MHRTPVVLILALVSLFPRTGSTQDDHHHGHRTDSPFPPEFLINTYTPGDQSSVAMAFRPQHTGNFPYVVVWASDGQDGSGLGTFGRLMNGGAEFRVNTYTTGDQDEPSVAMDGTGNFVVVWASPHDGSGQGVFGQRFLPSGTPSGPEFRVNTYTTGSQYQASVASDSTTGNFMVVWTSGGQDGDGKGVFGQRYAASGVPLGPEFRVNTYTTGVQYRAALPADNFGSFVVAWQDGAAPGGGSAGRGIFGQRFDASSGAPLGPEFQVETYTTGFQGSPAVSRRTGGYFVVVWHSEGQDGSGLGIFGQRYANSGAPVGSEFRVNTYTTGNQGYPTAANDNAGCVLVAWEDAGQDGSGPGVFAQLYYLGYANTYPEWRFNSYVTSSQEKPSIAGFEGGFIVTWQSQGQDGSGYGIYGEGEIHFIPVELMQFQVE